MMATSGVYQSKLDLNVAARSIWKAAFEDMQSVLPRAVPDAVERVEYSGTKNEVGSICTIHFHRSTFARQSSLAESSAVSSPSICLCLLNGH
jgi:hypothetical protein